MFFPFHDDNPTERTAVVTYALVAVNVLVFLWFYRMEEPQKRLIACRRGFIPARIAQLTDPKPIEVPLQRKVLRHPRDGHVVAVAQKNVRLDPEPQEILTSLLSCMFLHGGWLHLIGNMWFLWLFGNNVEDRLGKVLFLVLYLFGGLLASGCHWVVDPASKTPIIGASGAVATVLGAYAITWPWARVHTVLVLIIFITIVDLPALLVLGVWFLGQLLEATKALELGITGGVAWWAHVGGFIAGLILMPIFSAAVGAGTPENPEQESMDDLPY